MTRCSLSVTDLGAPANTMLDESTRFVTIKAWTSIFMGSSSIMTVVHAAVGEAKKRLGTDDGDLFVQHEVTDGKRGGQRDHLALC